MLLGLCFSLTTYTREEVCPPEEEDAVIQFRALVRSFGDRYKVTGYTINGVDRSSYLDTLHLRNKVIDFRAYNVARQLVRRSSTARDPKACYMNVTYGGIYRQDTTQVVSASIVDGRIINISTYYDSNPLSISVWIYRGLIRSGISLDGFKLVPDNVDMIQTGLVVRVIQTGNTLEFRSTNLSVPASLFFTLR